MSEHAKYSDIKSYYKTHNLANNYSELLDLVKDADIDPDTLKYDCELLDKEGNNITVEGLITKLNINITHNVKNIPTEPSPTEPSPTEPSPTEPSPSE